MAEKKPCPHCLFDAKSWQVWDDAGGFEVVRMCNLCAISLMGQDVDVREIEDEPGK